jgi:hypothetical protein
VTVSRGSSVTEATTVVRSPTLREEVLGVRLSTRGEWLKETPPAGEPSATTARVRVVEVEAPWESVTTRVRGTEPGRWGAVH